MCVLVRVKLKKTFNICQKACFYDYGSALKNVAKLDRNVVLSHSDSVLTNLSWIYLLTWQCNM